METHDIDPIDLLVSNLYPFEATLGAGADEATCIENIDVGGPAMIRAAAKNHDFVAVATSPADYALISAEMTAKKGALGLALRRKLAAAAFARTASYDAAIAGWMSRDEPLGAAADPGGRAPADAALWREPPSAGGFLRHGRAPARRRHRPPAPGQGAELQQSERHRRRL